MTDCKDVTIIGGGSAGLFAAFYSGMRDLSTRIIEYQPKLGGKIHIYPEKMIWDVGGVTPITGAQLMKQMEEQALTFDPEVVLSEKVERLEKNKEGNFVVSTNKGRKYLSRTVILATGTGIIKPIKLDLDGASRFEVSNLHYTVQSLNRFKGKHIIISGGGNTAIDWANELEPLANKVTVVYRGDEFKAVESFLKKLEASSASVYKNTTIETLIADERGEKIQTVLLKDQESGTESLLEIDDLIISYGFEKELTFIKESPLDIALWKELLVQGSPKAETNVKGLYASGDILEFDGKVRLIAGAFNDAVNAVNQVKLYLDPDAKPKGKVSSHNDKFDDKNKELLSNLYSK